MQKLANATNSVYQGQKEMEKRTDVLEMMFHGTGKEEMAQRVKKNRTDDKEEKLPIYQNAAHEEKGMKQTALHFAATSGDEDVVETLLKANVNAQARDEHGETALHKAVKAGQKQIVEVLLKAGGDPSPGDKDGNTPLHQAAFFGSTEIIQLLLAFGADCLAKNKDGERPTDKAEYGYRVARKGLSGIANGDIQVTPEQMTVYVTAVGRYHDISNILQKAQADKDIKTQGIEVEAVLTELEKPQKMNSTFHREAVVETRVFAMTELNLVNSDLCKALHNSVEEFYYHLDKLPNSGFALGWDVLPPDVTLLDEGLPDKFSGIS